MNFDSKILKPLDEAKYLSQENTWRYRAIIRLMYKSYEKMKYTLRREDVMLMLKDYEEFAEYTEDQLKHDLGMLTDWKNLIAKTDDLHVNTLEEYLNKVFLYQLSPYTIEIERMLIQLENMTAEGGGGASLESSLVETFKNELFSLAQSADETPLEAYNRWNRLNESFRKLNENYQDYISNFYSPNTEELMKTTAFLLFKERFIEYLRQFIKGIQVNGNQIRAFMEQTDMQPVNNILHKAADYAESIPRPGQTFNRKEYLEINMGRYDSMKEWFCFSVGKLPLYEQLIQHTNEIIRKITRYALQIADKRNNSPTRKQEYRKLMEIFLQCGQIEEAHKLSALIFGAGCTRHIFAEQERETESISSGIYAEAPRQVVVKPRVRNYREKAVKNPIGNKEKEREQKLREVLERRGREEEMARRLIVNNRIDFKALPVISPTERSMLLRWLSRKTNKGPAYGGRTEFGRDYVIRAEGNETIEVKCQDGSLFMPWYIIEFN